MLVISVPDNFPPHHFYAQAIPFPKLSQTKTVNKRNFSSVLLHKFTY